MDRARDHVCYTIHIHTFPSIFCINLYIVEAMCSCQYFHFQYRTAGFHIYNSLLWQRKTWVSWSSLYFSLDQSPLYKQSFIATAISSSVKILTLPHLVSDILYCKHWSTWIPFSTIGVWLASQIAELVKKKNNNLPAVQETWFDSWVRKIPWRRAWQSTPVFLPGESPWAEEPGGLQSVGSQRVRHSWATKQSCP